MLTGGSSLSALRNREKRSSPNKERVAPVKMSDNCIIACKIKKKYAPLQLIIEKLLDNK
jgi:hypothetical protein